MSNNAYRLKVLLLLFAAAAVGLVSRLLPIGVILWDKYVGDAVYAAAFYLVVSLIWRDWPIATKVLITTIYVVAIEVFQLTPVPTQLGQSRQIVVKLFAYIVLGSKFSWWDLLAYGVGIAVVASVDRWIRHVYVPSGHA